MSQKAKMNGSATINGAGWKTITAPRMICSKAERNISPLIGINPRVADHAAISVQPPRNHYQYQEHLLFAFSVQMKGVLLYFFFLINLF